MTHISVCLRAKELNRTTSFNRQVSHLFILYGSVPTTQRSYLEKVTLNYSIIPRSLVFSTEQSQVSSSWIKNSTFLFNTNIDSKQNMLGCRSGEVKTDPNSDRESFPSKLSNLPFSLSIRFSFFLIKYEYSILTLFSFSIR